MVLIKTISKTKSALYSIYISHKTFLRLPIEEHTCVTYCTIGERSNTMDGPVLVSYSAAESENDREVFNEYLGINIHKLCIDLFG